METKAGRRQRRQFTDEFKAGAVALVLDQGKPIPEVARDLDLTESSLRAWVERARADRGRGRPGVLVSTEREELARLPGVSDEEGRLTREPRWKVLVAAVVVLAALAAACSSSSPAAQRAPADELLSAADAEAIAGRWQGAWVMPFRMGDPATSRIGTREVWAVTGSELTWDGDVETTEPMTLLASCLVKVGDRQFRYHAFAFVEGQLVVDGAIGARDGAAIVVCSSLGYVYTFDGSTCRYWEKAFGGRRLTPHPATCKVDGARFEATSADDVTAPHVMQVDGQLVRRDTESPRAPATRFDTLAAAKASLLE